MFGRIADTIALVAIGIYCLIIKNAVANLEMTEYATLFGYLSILCFALALDFVFNNPVLRKVGLGSKK